MKDTFPKIILNWLAVLLWMAVIYYFSSQPDLKSELEPFWDMFFRKIAHAAEFFVLAYLFFQAYRSMGVSKGRSLVLTFIFALAYAGFDEWHQGLVAGRTASALDVGIDGFGVFAFIFLKFISREELV